MLHGGEVGLWTWVIAQRLFVLHWALKVAQNAYTLPSLDFLLLWIEALRQSSELFLCCCATYHFPCCELM
jgi:hypothetical protein